MTKNVQFIVVTLQDLDSVSLLIENVDAGAVPGDLIRVTLPVYTAVSFWRGFRGSLYVGLAEGSTDGTERNEHDERNPEHGSERAIFTDI